jgi:hypothetical protein
VYLEHILPTPAGHRENLRSGRFRLFSAYSPHAGPPSPYDQDHPPGLRHACLTGSLPFAVRT